MNNEATLNPNELHPSEIAGLALTDPKLKLTNRERKALKRNREFALTEPPVKLRKARTVGVSAKLDKANAKRDARRRSGPGAPQCEPKPEGDRVVERLNRYTLVRLCKFLKRSARRAATEMYAAKKTTGRFSDAHKREQDRQIALFRAAGRLIQLRLNPEPSNEV